MQNFDELKPAKLRSRSPKRRSSQSMLDLPAIDATSSLPSAAHSEIDDALLSSELLPKIELEPKISQSSSATSSASSQEQHIPASNDGVVVDDEAQMDVDLEQSDSASANSSQSIAAVGALLKEQQPKELEVLSEAELAQAPTPNSILSASISNASLSTLIKKTSHSPSPSKLLAQKEGEKTKDKIANELGRIRAVLNQSEALNRNLTESVQALQKRQLQAERRVFFNSAVAYILFCVVIASGLYFSLNYKAKAKYNEQLAQIEGYKSLVNVKQILEQEFEKSQIASKQAFEVYQLSEQGRYDEALQRFTEVRGNLNHPAELALLEERIENIRWKLANNSYREALGLYLEGNLEQARDTFFKSQSYKKDTPYTHLLNHYLAMSLFNLGDYEGARQFFREALSADLAPEMDAISRYNFAFASEKVGANTEAYEAYEAFIKKYRYHRLADDASKRQSRLERARVQARPRRADTAND
ncbi:MAG: tetratricopeptide repeat protein [Bradymonadales bacterium]|jgi:hypothetical protein